MDDNWINDHVSPMLDFKLFMAATTCNHPWAKCIVLRIKLTNRLNVKTSLDNHVVENITDL